MKINLPTKITIARIVLIPIFIILWYSDFLGTFELGSIKSLCVTIFFAFLCITDWIDGYLARKNKQVTDLGKFLDPIADKILVFSVYFLLLNEQIIDPISLIIMMSREFIVATIRMNAAQDNFVIAAEMGGKIKTVAQMISLILLLLCIQDINNLAKVIVFGIYWLSVILTTTSGIHYVKAYIEFLKTKNEV
jgi:CDP-diacylglycerol--glycerol-3-phosphate 3-phosphatidyltransferase